MNRSSRTPQRLTVEPHPLDAGHPPPWADGWGQDNFGVFVEIRFSDVVQRLRWIAPGKFKMGSPGREPGRWEDEGPRHEVRLTRGYWLFDTPCTQALWEAVMGSNPSKYKSAQRPMESVSWEEVQEFLTRINARFPGLGLSLPTEAQWECACRAGTETALYTGPIEIVGLNNAPALDGIAWYGGNSGVGYELEEGYDSSDWVEKQYDFGRTGTREVKGKSPNGWGLYDMLGNVWEWCADGRREYEAGVHEDPMGPLEAGAERVVRGGSWHYSARHVRAAFRYQCNPDDRYGFLGFRCARVQS